VDLADFGRSLSHLSPVRRVLEVGCGDGYVVEQLVAQFPQADIVGIDIADTPGRMYRGDRSRVRFEQISTGALLESGGAAFDLVVLSDVLHHVPVDQRQALLADVRALTVPGGHVAIKDWLAGRNPASMAAYVSDRWISGDRPHFFRDRTDFFDTVTRGCGSVDVIGEGRVPPRSNNIFVTLRAV